MDINREKLETAVNQLQITGSGYDILRYVCLPELLGKNSNTILYIMGKNLSRKLIFSSYEDIYSFFAKAGWGNLTLIKEKRREIIFELSGESIDQRLDTEIGQEFRLEAGILSEAIEQIKSASCECIEEIKRKKHSVQFNVIYSK
ncbi:DUF2507 domain-containing protein [Aquibacillus albus]|uniref:Hydrocarbon binding protein n=1 Tax=Aquibacillus albus TaxID=1168171 RepID=A0ABS2N1G2_9BACI|nr:putative hydrocarbon binding protein [Aquibacillus albus]